jgi:hypothetical protein
MAGPTLDIPWAGTSYSPPVSTDLPTLEAAIVAQLQAEVSGFEVVHFPDVPEKYRMTHRVGAALVIFKDADFGQTLSTDRIVQEVELDFEIGIAVRALGWAYASGDAAGLGAYQMLSQCRAALTGFQIAGCTKMWPKRIRFVDRDEQGGVFYYALTMALKTWWVEQSTVDNYPTLAQVTVLETGGQTTVPVPAADYTFNSSDLIQLPNQNVSSVIVQSRDGANTYFAGTDYSLDPVNGLITRLGGNGVIPVGATVRIAYGWSEVVTAMPYAPTDFDDRLDVDQEQSFDQD